MIFWIVLASFVAPGFAHGLMGQTRAMWIVFGAVILLFCATSVSTVTLPLAFAVWIGSSVDAALRYRKMRPLIPWSVPYALAAAGSSIAVAILMRMFVVEAFKAPSTSMNPTIQLGDHFFIAKWRTAHAGDIITFRHPCQPDRDYVKRVIALANQTVEIRCNIVYVDGKPVPHTLVDADATYQDYYEDMTGSGSRWTEKRASRYHEELGGHGYDIFSDTGEPERAQSRKRGPLPEGDAKDFPQQILYSCANATDAEPRLPANQRPGKIEQTAPDTDPCQPHRRYVVPEGHVFVLGDNRANSNDSRYWGSVPVENIKGVAVGIWLPVGRFGAIE